MSDDFKQALQTIFAALIIGFFAIGFVVQGGEPSGCSEEYEPDPRTMPIAMAQKFVTQHLKSPRSAKFPWSHDEFTVYALEGDGWENCYEVRGYVDAQNSFGGEIRSNFMVQMKDLGKDQWRLLEIRID